MNRIDFILDNKRVEKKVEDIKRHKESLVSDIYVKVNFKNSPDQLSLAALKLGMVPAPEIKYIDLAKTP